MRSDAPVVLFVDESPQALNEIHLHIEPIFTTIGLRSVGPLLDYVERLHADVVVLSDRLKHRGRNTRGILARLRDKYSGAVLILTDCISEAERLHWKESGADDCFLHPTRTFERVMQLSDRVQRLAHHREVEP